MLSISRARTIARPAILPARPTLATVAPAEQTPVGSALRQVTTVDHQGTVIAFARAIGGSDLYYNVLDLTVTTTAADSQEWTGFSKLSFPQELRSAGLGIVTVADVGGSILAAADGPIKVLSDEKYVHVFQLSTRGTLLLNRFMFKRVAQPGGGVPIPVLEPIWEVRFQRSGKEDIPDGPRDSQSYTSPDGVPFIEPTIELPMLCDIDGERFEAMILPNQTSTGNRWQFFAVNSATKTLDLFSFPMDENGLFDLTETVLDSAGNVEPDAALTLSWQDGSGTEVALELSGSPAATMYTLRERVRAAGGDDLLLKRTARIMLVQPVRQAGGELQLATIDFALGKDGTLSRVPASTVLGTVQPANDALQFNDSAYLCLPANPSLQLTGSFRTEFWLYPASLVADDQYVFRGDPAVAATESAPYVKLTRDLKIASGFGTGSAAVAAVTADPVVSPAQWVHVSVSYDGTVSNGNFRVLINGNSVPVSGGDTTGGPAGRPITAISGQRDGIIGILDGLRLWQVRGGTETLVGDWPCDTVDYDLNPPTTPDNSGNHNDAGVYGAVLVSSTAPNSADTEGTLYVDAEGLSSYAGLLSFAEPSDSASLLTGSDGLVHLYFAGRPEGDADGLFCVAQYDAETARAVYEGSWASVTTAGTQTGTLSFTAARSGTFMNQAELKVEQSSDPSLATVTIADGHGRSESWLGLPRALDRFVDVLNGASTDDVSDPGFRAGATTFYDNAGRYAMSRLPVLSHGSAACLVAMSRYPDLLQLAGAGVDEVTATSCTLTLTYTASHWTGASTITQRWPGLPVLTAGLLPVLSGTSGSYDYARTDSADATVYGLNGYDSSNTTHDVLMLARSGVTDLMVGISAGTRAELCNLTITLDAGGQQQLELIDIPRDQNAVAEQINASTLAPCLLVITDGLTAALRDLPSGMPALRDMRAWSTILVSFPEQPLAADATVLAQPPVPAGILQHSTVTVDGVQRTLTGASTMFRCLATSQPSNGGVPLVADTTGNTGGSANLITAAVNGGWIRVSPHKAIETNGKNAVVWDQAGPTADVLAIPGDVTVETWCRPGILQADTDRPRLIGYNRTGSIDFPDEQIRWATGLRPAPSLYFNDSTAITGSYDLKGTDCTLQISVNPPNNQGTGQLVQLSTIGITQPYLTLSVDDDQKVVAGYASGALSLTSHSALPVKAWSQLTATIAEVDAATVTLRLYVNGVLDSEVSGAKASFSKVPGSLTAGSTSGAFPMQANGIFMWARALSPDDVARSVTSAPEPNDQDLVIAWYLTDGAGSTVTNVALEGYPFVSTIRNPSDTPWATRGIYSIAWAANRGYGLAALGTPLLGGWHHVASAYRTAYALELANNNYANCGNDASLDFGSTFSIEAWFTPKRTGAVQTLVSKPGNYELGLNYDNTVLLTVPTTSDAVGTIKLASTAKVEQGKPYYAVATVDSGAAKATPSSGQPANQTYYLHISLYVNGVLSGSFVRDDYTDPVAIATSTTPLNLGRSSAGAAYLTGQLSDVRLWNRVLTAEAIAATYRSHRLANQDGLVSSWRWSESHGKVGYDDNNLNNAVLSSNLLWRLYSPSAVLSIYVDGAEQLDVEVIDPESVGGYGIEQFTAAANRTDGQTLGNPFTGQLSEVRIWRLERTNEQIREDMYRQLSGAETGLAGYWPCNAGSGPIADDATGHGNEGTLYPDSNPPAWVTARAPISDETKQVYNVLGGLRDEYDIRITGIPSVVEYADTRLDAYGVLYSVMKRCYAADSAGVPDLITGFTVGDLDTTYAGQVQTAPSLVGFIEGAPPIPSENQTNPWWNEVNYINSYAENTTVRLVQSQTTTTAFSGSEHTGDATSIEGKVGIYLSTSAGISVGIGEEVDWEVATAEGHLGYAGDSSTERGSETELGFGYGKTTTATDELSAGGEWEPAEHILNPVVGRRYVPENIGYALVKSLTADLYLVTLRGSNTVVKMTLVPDANIPEDVNIINFPIDPQYVKNGTLDGMVGFTPDPSFPYADLQPSSYFRPLEAYNLKRAIERQDQQLEAYYQQFDTSNLSQGIRLGAQIGAADMNTGFTKFRDEILPADPAYDWKQGLAKRSVANTYVWTATGGLHTEQSELVDSYSESYSGMSSWDMTNGIAFDLAAAMVVGLYGEFDALFSGSVEVVSVRSKESESGFGLEVDFTPDRYLKRPVLDSDGQPVGYTEDNAPGKVTGYRFMSFFVPPSEHNFDLFNAQVIDKNWLNNSADPNAAALRTATVQTNGAWRVLHRVTFVSRVPPPLQPASTDTTAPPVVPPANLASNTLITRMIEGQLTGPSPSPSQIGAAVTATLGLSPSDPGLLAGLLTWWPTFLTAAEDKRSDAHRTLADLRTDLLGYLIQKYAAQAASAGGVPLARLLGRTP
jgi:large repetitive protein